MWRWQRPNELLQRSPLPIDVDQINQSPNIFDLSDGLGRESVGLVYVDTPGPKGFDPAGPEVTDYHQKGANGPNAVNHCQGWIDPDPDKG